MDCAKILEFLSEYLGFIDIHILRHQASFLTGKNITDVIERHIELS